MSKICVIYPTESLVDEFGGTFEGKVGICIIDGEIATTSIVHRSELPLMTAGLDCVPSIDGRGYLLPLNDELEAYRRIRREAADYILVSRPKLPSGFYRPQALWFGLFELSVEVGSLRIRVGHGLATALGWREGDGVAFGVAADHKSLAFCYDPEGSVLIGSDLTASYPLGVGLPRELESLSPGTWVPVAVEVRDQIVFVRLEDYITGSGRQSPEEIPDEFDFDLGPVHSAEPGTIRSGLFWCAAWLNAITPFR